MFYRQKWNAKKSFQYGSLSYQLLSQRVLLAGDLGASVPDSILPLEIPSTILSDIEKDSRVEQSARIVINDPIGPGGSREYAEPFDAVVHLAFGCTGTLIAPDVVLTARHCGTSPGDLINFGDNSNAPIFTATVGSVFAPDGNGTLLDGGDVEILTLTASVPATIATPMRLIDATDLLVGQVAATVGYGFNGIGSQGHSFSSDGFRWGGENIIDAYGSPADSTGSNIISTDFDDGSAGANTIAGSDATPLEFEATTAPGDSGGPVLVQSGSEWLIAGVLSGGTSSTSVYGDISWWTGTAIFRAEIESFGGAFVVSDVGNVQFDAPSYTEVGTINLSVDDNNAVGPVTVTVDVSSGDSEVLTLADDGTGTFTGSINSVVVSGTSGDGTLQVADDDIITVTYFDADDGEGQAITITDTAVIFRDDHGDDSATATAVVFPLGLLGEIEQAVDQDWFSFSATEGMQYDFATPLGSLSATTLTVYDSSGTNVLQSSSGSDPLISWLATVGGQYFVVVESSSTGLGTYVLTGMEVVPQSTVEFTSSSFSESGSVGVTVFEPNSSAASVVVTIEASSGDSETLTLGASGDMVYSAIINSAAGLANDQDGTLQVTQGDTITVTYADPDDGLGGSSTATDTATIVLDDHGSNSSTATSVAVPFAVLGDLEEDSDEDWFRFTAVEGVEYEFETSLSTLSDSTLRLYDTDGTTVLIFNDDGGANLASLINWQAPTSGVYFVSVQAFSPTQTGTYQLTATVDDTVIIDDHGSSSFTATSVSVPFTVLGDIEEDSDEDWFRFTAVAGVEYEFGTNLSTLSDSTLRLYDTDGATQLIFNDDGGAGLASLINWQAPTSGVFFLSVQAFSSTQTGTYQLTGAANAAVGGTIVGRHLFYDGSSFDGDAGVATANDDGAIDVSKSPLLGGTATVDNYSNFENGITGLFIDIDGLESTPQIGDFEFRVGNSNDPSTWGLLEVDPDISVRIASGDSGSDRISLIWPAGTIVDQWLEVSVLADGPGRIVNVTDVHYWGNQRGDTGNSATDTSVNSGDVSSVSSNFSGFALVGPNSDFDINKDGRVNSGDVSAVSSKFSGFGPTLQLITPLDRLQHNSSEVVSQQHPKEKTTEKTEVVEVVEVVDGAGESPDADKILESDKQPEDTSNATLNTSVSTSVSTSVKPVEVSVDLADTTPADPASNFEVNENEPLIDGDTSLFLSTPSESARALQVVHQPVVATSVEPDSPKVDFSLRPTVQPLEDTGLAMERLNRGSNHVRRSTDGLDSKDELAKRDERSLRNLKSREARIRASINEPRTEFKLADSNGHSPVDAAFSNLENTDFEQFDQDAFWADLLF